MSAVSLRVASVRIDRLPPDLQRQVLASLRLRAAIETFTEATPDADRLYRPEPLDMAA